MFQGVWNEILMQLHKDYTPFIMGVNYMFHRCNFAMQTFSNLPIVSRLKNFMQSLYRYFFKSSKKHLEFTKLTHIMETKGNKDHAKCENMLDFHVNTFEASFL